MKDTVLHTFFYPIELLDSKDNMYMTGQPVALPPPALPPFFLPSCIFLFLKIQNKSRKDDQPSGNQGPKTDN